VILFANEDFCRVAGYTLEELVGKPHSIVRHVDMPKAAFADLWATIRQNRVWYGRV
jgi:aerotaxis receptor